MQSSVLYAQGTDLQLRNYYADLLQIPVTQVLLHASAPNPQTGNVAITLATAGFAPPVPPSVLQHAEQAMQVTVNVIEDLSKPEATATRPKFVAQNSPKKRRQRQFFRHAVRPDAVSTKRKHTNKK